MHQKGANKAQKRCKPTENPEHAQPHPSGTHLARKSTTNTAAPDGNHPAPPTTA